MSCGRRSPILYRWLCIALTGWFSTGVERCVAADPLPQTKPLPAAEREGKKSRLEVVEKAIAERERELSRLREEADTLRHALGLRELKKPVPLKSGAELLTALPKDGYPKSGKDGLIERAATEKWLRASLPGQTVEWTAKIEDVKVSGKDPFEVELVVGDVPLFRMNRNTYHGFGPVIAVGGESVQVLLFNQKSHGLTRYSGCTLDEAKRLRDFKGIAVTFQAIVAKQSDRAGFLVTDKQNVLVDGKEKEFLALMIPVSNPTVDGFLPKACSPKEENASK